MSVASVSSEASGTAWVMSEDQRVELIDATESDPSWNRRPVRKRLGAPYIRFSARAAEGVAGGTKRSRTAFLRRIARDCDANF
jgi:hypothetical protein